MDRDYYEGQGEGILITSPLGGPRRFWTGLHLTRLMPIQNARGQDGLKCTPEQWYPSD